MRRAPDTTYRVIFLDKGSTPMNADAATPFRLYWWHGGNRCVSGWSVKMEIQQLAEMRLQTGYVFENGAPFYEKLGDERAAALLRALRAEGYRIVAERNVAPPD